MKTLIVDDELVSRTKLKLIMEDFGQCEAVEYGREAIAEYHHAHYIGKPFDLITLDINMPDPDGIMVLAEIRRAEEHLIAPGDDPATILMVTSYADKDRVVACVQAGCDDYIVKPFDDSLIRQKLNKLGVTNAKPDPPIVSDGMTSLMPAGSMLWIEEVHSFLDGHEIRLPPLPGIRAKFRDLMTAGATFQQISDLLKKDVAISVELIRMSNSAYYRGVRKNKSLEQAILRLGYAATERAVNMMLDRKSPTLKNEKYRPLIDEVWKHSLACAYAAESTSQVTGRSSPGDLFSMGLLHDIGKLALLQIVADIEARGGAGKEIPASRLVETIGDYHCSFGAEILEKWEYAESHVRCAHYHRVLQVEEEDIASELLIVHFANLVSKSLGYGFAAGSQADLEIDLEDAESASLLGLSQFQITGTRSKVAEQMEASADLF